MRMTHIIMCGILAFSFGYGIYWVSGGNFDRDWRLGIVTTLCCVSWWLLARSRPFEDAIDRIIDESIEEALAEFSKDGELK